MASSNTDVEFVPPSGFLAKAPLSAAVRVGDLVLVSGQIGIDDAGVALRGMAEQTKACIEAVAAALAPVGGSLADVVQTRVYLTDFSGYDDYNRVYREYFAEPFPARATVGTPQLALGAQIEIEAVAVLRRAD